MPPAISYVSKLLFVTFGTLFKNSLMRACEAEARCTSDITQPNEAKGHVRRNTYKINSVIFPGSILPSMASLPPYHTVIKTLKPTISDITGANRDSIDASFSVVVL